MAGPPDGSNKDRQMHMLLLQRIKWRRGQVTSGSFFAVQSPL